MNYNIKNGSGEFIHYSTPKAIQQIKGLGGEAKWLYTLMHDRMKLSYNNAIESMKKGKKINFADENGDIYIIYTVVEMCEDMEVSDKTIKRIKDRLIKANLLKEKRVFNGPTRFYLQDLSHVYFKNNSKRKNADFGEGEKSITQSVKVRTNNNNINNNKRINSVSLNEFNNDIDFNY